VKETKQEALLYRPVSSFTEEHHHNNLAPCNTSVWREIFNSRTTYLFFSCECKKNVILSYVILFLVEIQHSFFFRNLSTMIKKCKPSLLLYPLQKIHNYRKVSLQSIYSYIPWEKRSSSQCSDQVMGRTSEESWFVSDRGKGLFLLQNVQTSRRSIQPPIQWVSRSITPRLKRQRREADQSHLVPRL
jgi:hypothetical protein